MLEKRRHKVTQLLRYCSALIYLALVILIAQAAFYQGLAQYLVSSALVTKSDADILQAITSDSKNPEAYKTRAVMFLREENYPEAIKNINSAIELRPNDYLLWLRLGYCRYKMDDYKGAKIAYNKAITLAPNYAQPKRYMGRMLLKVKDLNNAFDYLSKAAAIDESRLPEVLHLARKSYPGDPDAIEKAVKPSSLQAKKTTALYFIKHQILSDKMKDFLLSDKLGKAEKDEAIAKLIKIKDFETAFLVWKSKTKVKVDNNDLLVNGDFENEIDQDENTFGWIINSQEKNIIYSVDTSNAYSNSVALRITFEGNSKTAAPLLSQLIPVDPGESYRLTFSAYTKDIVTGGLPVIAVIDADSGNLIKESTPLSSPKKWDQFSIDFSSSSKTDAVFVSVQRLTCGSNSCPIFGQLWLDNFKLFIQSE